MTQSGVKTWILLDGITKIQSQPLPTEQLQLAILKMTERDWSRFYVWTAGWANWQLLKEFLNSDQKDFARPGGTLSEENVKSHIQSQIQKNKKQAAEAQAALFVQSTEDTVTKAAQWKPNNKSITMVSSTEETFTEQANHMQKDFNGDTIDLEHAVHKPPDPLNFSEISEAYKNRAVRHELKIEVLLISQKGKTFKSYSKNISLSGSLLEDNIPFDFYGLQFDLVVVNRNPSNPQNSRVQVRAETIGEGITQRVRFLHPSDTQKQRLMNLLNDYITQQTKVKKSS